MGHPSSPRLRRTSGAWGKSGQFPVAKWPVETSDQSSWQGSQLERFLAFDFGGDPIEEGLMPTRHRNLENAGNSIAMDRFDRIN